MHTLTFAYKKSQKNHSKSQTNQNFDKLRSISENKIYTES